MQPSSNPRPAQPPAPAQPVIAADGRCFDITEIEFQGITLLPEDRQLAILEPFINQCLGLVQINELIRQLTDWYIEAGYIAAYIDFLPASVTVRSGRSRSPFELGLEWLVDFKKPNFNGRRALAKEKRDGSTWKLVKLDIEGNKPAHHSYIFAKSGGRQKNIGFITSAAWSPICKQNIAIGTVRTPHGNVGDNLFVEIYYQREMHWSRVMAEATVVDKPFWNPPRRRATPPGPY